MNADEIKSIAAIPGMETLRAMFAQVINSPRQRFAVVLNEVAKLSPQAAVAAAAPAEPVEAPAEAPAEAAAVEAAPTEDVGAPAEAEGSESNS
jgi:hypothetical protein